LKTLIRITTVPSSLRTLLKGQHKFMSQYFNVIGIASPGEALLEVNQNEGIRTIAVKMTRSITPLKDLIAVYELYRIFKIEKPFIVHTHTPKAGTLGMIAAKLAGVKHRLHTVAGLPLLETQGLKRLILDGVEKITYMCATKVLPNSNGLKQIIVTNNYTKLNKIHVIGNGSSNGIDSNHYDLKCVSSKQKESIKVQLGISNTDLVFIFIGRLVSDKGINELVEAFNKLSQEEKNIKLLLVGPREDHLDPLLPQTEDLIKKNKNILAVGVQIDIRPYVAISQVLVFPSYREGFPNVVLQASCMELPCIVSDINGCNEIIKHNLNGLIIPKKDVKALVYAMKFMIKNPVERLKMAEKSRTQIIKNFEQKFVWNELLKFYKSLES